MSLGNANDMSKVNGLINELETNGKTVIKVKKEKGLMERSEYDKDKIILAEDNKQILFG